MSVVPIDRNDADSGGVRFPLFDGLRALAVVGVAYSHWMPERFQFGVPWGRLGVQLFFVLSGFLITTILLRECSRTERIGLVPGWPLIRAFIARRALRIFPIYWLTLICALLIGLPDVVEGFWWHFFYASNILFAIEGQWAGPISHVWTLAVEEQFYLVWPVLIVFSAAIWRWRIVTGVVVLCALVYLLLGFEAEDTRVFLSILPVPAFLAIASGALLAIVRHEGHVPHVIAHPGAALVGAMMLAGAIVLSTSDTDLQGIGAGLTPILVVAFATCVIAWAAEPRRGLLADLLQLRPVVFLGTISYGFYLYHNFATPVFAYGIREGWLSPWVNWGIQAPVLRFAFTLVVAAASWYLLERPLGRFRERIAYSPGSTAPGLASACNRHRDT